MIKVAKLVWLYCLTAFCSYAQSVNNSTRFINELYKDAHLLKYVNVNSFRCITTYNEDKIITVKCTGKVNKDSFGYELILRDTANLYRAGDFFASDDYQYVNSKAFYNSTSLSLRTLKYTNDNSLVDPINTLYGDFFGPVARYYNCSDAKIILIRGLNFYCNGSHCTNYKVLALIHDNSGLRVKVIDYPGYYPSILRIPS